MELIIAGTNMDVTPEARRYITKKINRVNKHLPDIIDTKVEVSDEKTKSREARYLVRVTLHSGVGRLVTHGEERGESVNAAVDMVVDGMTRPLERRKGKLYDKSRGRVRTKGAVEQVMPSPEERKVVKTKRFAIPPMTLQEAINEMERLEHNFFLFVDAKTEETQLLYRRNDGNYGLIEPEFSKK